MGVSWLIRGAILYLDRSREEFQEDIADNYSKIQKYDLELLPLWLDLFCPGCAECVRHDGFGHRALSTAAGC